MNILGISAFYHDSAAALVVDGAIAAAAQEERFTRKKHDESFPSQAVSYCLKDADLAVEDLDYVVFYEKPLLKFDRLMETYLAFAPVGFRSFRKAIPHWAKQKLFLNREMRKGLNDRYKKPLVFVEHHEAHAASAFFPSPFEDAAILTVDGVGEWATTTLGVGEGNRIRIEEQINFPHSLGLLYSAFTYYCGFKVNSGEYKLMGLAPYGEPKYADLIREHLIDLRPDGSFRLNLKYFTYCQKLRMTGRRFAKLFGQPRRKSESELTQFYMDMAASVQLVTEEAMLGLARRAHEVTGKKNLCLAGGVALNCVANGRLLREGPFENIWIQPAAGDAGGSLGAAQFLWHQILDNPREVGAGSDQGGSLYGPGFDDDEIAAFLDGAGAKYQTMPDESAMCAKVAELIDSEKVIGWFQGRMEFGPRALGSRSILGDARSTEMQRVMNLKIKFRESFRPFAPVVLREDVADYFEMEAQQDSPYMLLVADVRKDKLTECDAAMEGAKGLDKLNVARSVIPAVTHVDNSARVQTTDADRHGAYHQLLEKFKQRTGSPVLINTSFNVRGEPIVCTPEDAWRCFMVTDMDVLVLGSHVLLKDEQPENPDFDRQKHLAEFELD